jgi:hypothetical protein
MKGVVAHYEEHQKTMLMNEALWTVAGDIHGAAIEVAAEFVESAIPDPDRCEDIANSIQESILKGVSWIKAAFLGEAYCLIKERADFVSGSREKLEEFLTSLIGFMDLVKNDQKAKVLIDVCLEYPTIRQRALADESTADGSRWLDFKRSLLYAKYAVSASVLDKMLRLERISFLKIWMNYDCDLAPLLQDLNERHAIYVACSEEMTRVYRRFASLPLLEGGLKHFVFDENCGIYRWPFDVELGLSGATAKDVCKMRDIKMRSITGVGSAVLWEKVVKMCAVCHRNRAQFICEKCRRFVWCEKCKESCCPECGSVCKA